MKHSEISKYYSCCILRLHKVVETPAQEKLSAGEQSAPYSVSDIPCPLSDTEFQVLEKIHRNSRTLTHLPLRSRLNRVVSLLQKYQNKNCYNQ